jgi:dTMP kinase
VFALSDIMTHMDGILIAFEGIDGAGKTTQAKLLADALTRAGEKVVSSKEPTDGHWGRKIRESAENGRMSLLEELQAFIEDRKEHVANLIQPALDRGEIVILDRYFYSTIAYQGSRGKGVEAIEGDMRSMFPVPDIVFALDVAPEIGLERISDSRGETPNKFERKNGLKRIRQVFQTLAERSAEITVIDGTPPVEFVFNAVGHVLLATVLKTKRCAKSYDCDAFYCSYRINGECQWAKAYPELAAK